MRWVLRIGLAVVALFVFFWGSIALYFTYAERHKSLLESNLEAVFKREVSIGEVRTAWRRLSPMVQITDFEVAGDNEGLPALAFDSFSAEIAPMSLLRFWPKITRLSVESPQLEIVSLPENRLQIAGLVLGQNNESWGFSPKRLISWLLNHEDVSWHNGQVVWRRADAREQRYQNISFLYLREGEIRTLSAVTDTAKGALAVRSRTEGNMLHDRQWNATLEVLGDQGQRLLSSDDLALEVEKGLGRLQLRSLNIDRVRDFLLLTGLGEAAPWVLDSRLSGVLHNVQFDFSGPFLQFYNWSLDASASDVSFKSSQTLPGMTALNGSVSARARGGTFEFTSNDAMFDWPTMFDQSFAIEQAQGKFRWQITDTGQINIHLEQASFDDGTVTISSVDAHTEIEPRAQRITTMADLFTSGPVEDMRFEDGEIVSDAPARKIRLDANAEFSVSKVENTARYIPTHKKVRNLRNWWQGAFLNGQISNAKVSYQGPLSLDAINTGSAIISGSASYDNVTLDYGFERDWPVLNQGRGQMQLDNSGLTIEPDQVWMDEDKLESAVVSIKPLFSIGRKVEIQGVMQTSLATVAEFLFSGPLLSPEQLALQEQEPFPIVAEGGEVDAEVQISIPLSDMRLAKVKGQALVKDGRVVLPSGVALDNVATELSFTESSASAKTITANFLGGEMTAELITTEEAQPPKLKFIGQGSAEMSGLEPWIGTHLLSWLDGTTDWQGEVAIDGETVTVDAQTELQGVVVSAPAPLEKPAQQPERLDIALRIGGSSVTPELALDYGTQLRVHMVGDPEKDNALLDRARILLADNVQSRPRITPRGVNIEVDQTEFDLDTWLSAVIDLALLPVELEDGETDTSVLDAMRGIKINSEKTTFLSRPFGKFRASAASIDGWSWNGILQGDNINGALRATPRADLAEYVLNLAYLHIVEAPPSNEAPEPIDNSLRPQDYPLISLSANTFRMADKTLGRLVVAGAPNGEQWQLSEFRLDNTDIRSTGTGSWKNSEANGSLTEITINTEIDEAGGVLDEMEFNDLIGRGEGRFKANINWIGAPHEFDFARLNGDFDLQIKDGELLQVESGAGRLIGLLNFNSILRRLTFDFRDVFASGLRFDKMQYTGILADGKAIMREAFMLSPAVFVQMEGNIDLNKELIDMDIHASPELGGNLALLSAIANPTAGAVVFLTQRIFKDQMRSNSLMSYRAEGTWEDFELVEIDNDGEPVSSANGNSGNSQ